VSFLNSSYLVVARMPVKSPKSNNSSVKSSPTTRRPRQEQNNQPIDTKTGGD
jgi:hypothetical protein